MKSTKNKQKNKTKKRQKVKINKKRKHIGGAAASSNNTIAQTNERGRPIDSRITGIIGNGRDRNMISRRAETAAEEARINLFRDGLDVAAQWRVQAEEARRNLLTAQAEETRLNLLRAQAELRAEETRLNLLRAQAELQAAQDRLDSALWARGIRDAGGYQAIG